jgi:hypothetical protein
MRDVESSTNSDHDPGADTGFLKQPRTAQSVKDCLLVNISGQQKKVDDIANDIFFHDENERHSVHRLDTVYALSRGDEHRLGSVPPYGRWHTCDTYQAT